MLEIKPRGEKERGREKDRKVSSL